MTFWVFSCDFFRMVYVTFLWIIPRLLLRRTQFDMNTRHHHLDIPLRQCTKNDLLCAAALKEWALAADIPVSLASTLDVQVSGRCKLPAGFWAEPPKILEIWPYVHSIQQPFDVFLWNRQTNLWLLFSWNYGILKSWPHSCLFRFFILVSFSDKEAPSLTHLIGDYVKNEWKMM